MTYNVLAPRRFGIELELSRRLVNVNYHDRAKNNVWHELKSGILRMQQNGLISAGWKVKTDTSCGGEIVSPILVAPKGLAEIGRVCDFAISLSKKYGKPLVDGECGLHLHFDAFDMKPQHLGNLFCILHMAEPIIYSMYPRRNPNYCAPIDINLALASRFRDWIDVRDVWYRPSNNVKDKSVQYTTQFINTSNPGDNYDGTRYHGFNIHCYWKLGTVEFRYGAGTFDYNQIKAYYDMCLAMVNRSVYGPKVKLEQGLENMTYRQLMTHYCSGYRFRKYISKLSKLCGFSRPTIKLILDLVKKNNSALLKKDNRFKNTIINASNKQDYIYRHHITGYQFDHNGRPIDGFIPKTIPVTLVKNSVNDGTYTLRSAVPHVTFDIRITVDVPKSTLDYILDTQLQISKSELTGDEFYFMGKKQNSVPGKIKEKVKAI